VDEKERYRLERGTLCIDIKLKSTRQLFDYRDPAPFRERDLDEDAVAYILGAVEDIGSERSFKLVLWLAEEPEPHLPEEMIRESIRAHFEYERDAVRRRVHKLLRHGRSIAMIGVTVLFACLGAAELLNTQTTPTWQRILREGLVIMGWVALWRPVEVLLYDWRPLLAERRLLERVISAPVELRFDGLPD
jgi:hypothetical protein